MPLLVCYGCGRQRTVEKPGNKKFSCSNCGARDIRAVRRIKAWMDTADQEGEERHAARGQTYSGLLWIAQQKGYKPGWVGWRFKKIFGAWPNGESSLPPAAPTSRLIVYLRKRNAAYAARMRAEEKKSAAPPKPEATSALMSQEDFNVEWK